MPLNCGLNNDKTCMNDSHLVMLFTLSVTFTLHFRINITRFFFSESTSYNEKYLRPGRI